MKKEVVLDLRGQMPINASISKCRGSIQRPSERKIIVDIFAGGGGASVGIEMALGKQVDIAINHDPDAILMHETNHQNTKHYCESVWDVEPMDATQGNSVGLLWASPDCKHFSKAKGGKPKDKNIRALPWAIVKWASKVRPDVIIAENVEEITTWGPLDDEGYPIKEKKGQTFKKFIEALKSLGYAVEWKELVAADYGAPTTRKRWYMIARCDGKPIVWPRSTHGKRGSAAVESGILKPWVPVHTVLDLQDIGKSIFDRSKPLADNTLKRIARGIEKFVVNDPNPFIMQIGQTGFSNDRNRSKDDPLSTIVTKQEHCLVTPSLVPIGYGERKGQKARVHDVKEPLGTIVTSQKHYLTTPILLQYHSEQSGKEVRGQHVDDPIMTIDASPRYALASCVVKHYGGNYNGGGSSAKEPLHTITTTDHNALVNMFLTKFYKTGVGQSMDDPLHTITTSAGHFGKISILTVDNSKLECLDEEAIKKCNYVAQFIIQYYSSDTPGQSLYDPLKTIVTKDRFALITVKGIDYVIVDIFMRMLKPNELYKAQGFPADYIIAEDYMGRPYPTTKQVARCGNSVVPIMAQILVSSNCNHLRVGERIPKFRIETDIRGEMMLV